MGQVVSLFRDKELPEELSHRPGRTLMSGPQANPHSSTAGSRPPGVSADVHAVHADSGLEALYERGCELEAEAEDYGCRATRDQAAGLYRAVLERNPAHPAAHSNLGRLLHGVGDLDGAEAHYRSAVRLAPEESVYWYNLGVVLQDRGQRAQSMTAYRVALVLDPGSRDAHFNLAGLLEASGDIKGAFRHLSTYRRLCGRARPR